MAALIEAVVRDLENLHEEFQAEFNQQKDASEGLLNRANALCDQMEKLRQEATLEQGEHTLMSSQHAFKELKRDIQHSHAQQKTSRKTLSRKIQKTLDKIHHIPHQQIEDILPSQLQNAKQKVKEAQEQFTSGISSYRKEIEQRITSIHDALALTKEASGHGR